MEKETKHKTSLSDEGLVDNGIVWYREDKLIKAVARLKIELFSRDLRLSEIEINNVINEIFGDKLIK